MATPKPMLRTELKRAPALDDHRGVAYMRDNVLMHIIDCHKATYPNAHCVFESLTEAAMFNASMMSPMELSAHHRLSLDEARVLWRMIAARQPSYTVVGVDWASKPD